MASKAKSINFAKGDANSKYFHACDTIKKNRSSINSFTTKDWYILSNPNYISNAISMEFKERFISDTCCSFNSNIDFSLNTNIISEEDNDFLCQVVFGDEIKAVLFDLACTR